MYVGPNFCQMIFYHFSNEEIVLLDFNQPETEEGFWVVEVDLRRRETALLPGCGDLYRTVERGAVCH